MSCDLDRQVLAGLQLYRRGKVRDIYDLGDLLLMVSSDRISAFDVVLPSVIPSKGAILTWLSVFWFGRLRDFIPNHFVTSEPASFPPSLSGLSADTRKRSMVVKKADRIDVECVVRGYLAGSAWRDYTSSGTISGELLPSGMRAGDVLPAPLFTPAVKHDRGHDVTISRGDLAATIGVKLARSLEEVSLSLYDEASRHARERGIIVADTKFEFGLVDGELTLIDEALTPDSSRFWLQHDYQPGGEQPSLDKQFVRDWLEQSGWNKQPPAPSLPPDVVTRTAQRYQEAYDRLTGSPSTTI
ncbi:MAG: phosphoribosylaminoimidazolesuccinocarboxamide synthase [Chloroflexota bacterium]|nr:phosphoribosylaminoimidazolesuccinocarboxamide synthase [Chloroflexota bacterium]